MEAFVPRRNAMSIVRMTDLDLTGKRVLIRQDLNVPVADGRVTSDQRITASHPDPQAGAGERARR
jgi:phosphoglycerate kinase